ncbi:hypothetical protein IGI04_031281 [Brassica rapa subsp. trilocularis]|uniref:CCHC-type domain-containing protein n=1 Tax=Brassica rapa subsp. trilocularis TaxID=1813537 RepID=A0ABQ7LVU8_BRACM|nr:hypothetical protein IGI04_031281 [Brassica rapa subsp. trilocularis]
MSNPWSRNHRASALLPPPLTSGDDRNSIPPLPPDPPDLVQYPPLSPSISVTPQTSRRSSLLLPAASPLEPASSVSDSETPDTEMILVDSTAVVLGPTENSTTLVVSRSEGTVATRSENTIAVKTSTENYTILKPKFSSPLHTNRASSSPPAPLKPTFSTTPQTTTVDLMKPLPSIVEFTRQSGEVVEVLVTYPWLPPTCTHCKELGHIVKNCLHIPLTKSPPLASKEKTKTQTKEVDKSATPTKTDKPKDARQSRTPTKQASFYRAKRASSADGSKVVGETSGTAETHVSFGPLKTIPSPPATTSTSQQPSLTPPVPPIGQSLPSQQPSLTPPHHPSLLFSPCLPQYLK